MTNWHRMIDKLDALSRTRALTDQESHYLEHAIAMKNPVRPWSDADDELLCELLSEDVRMAQIADRLGRTKNAVSGRISRIRNRYGWQAA